MESFVEKVGALLETRSLQLENVKTGSCLPIIPLCMGLSLRATKDVRSYALFSNAELKEVLLRDKELLYCNMRIRHVPVVEEVSLTLLNIAKFRGPKKRGRKMKHGEVDGEVLISAVYAKCNKLDRRDLWAQLNAFDHSSLPWLAGRDFNIVKKQAERLAGYGLNVAFGSSNWKRMVQVSDVCEDQIGWIIGVGEIKFWQDKWLYGQQLMDFAIPSMESMNMSVKEVLLNENDMLESCLSVLPHNMALAALAMKDNLSIEEDKCVWMGSVSGKFSLTSA
ncbi:hypothetical protein LguiB_013600 [Lonicera macranthoides]